MNYCGIDLAGVSSYAYVTDEKGRKLWAGPVETSKTTFGRLVKRFSHSGLSIAIEAGNQTVWVHDELVKLGAKVTVVNPTKVKLIAESRRKTDKIDAKILCELLRLDALPHPVHMPGPQARELREAGVPVVSGFHTPMEKECLDLLLRGNQAVVVCPARSIERMRLPLALKTAVEAGRLLLLSPFKARDRRPTAKLAEERNRFVAALASEVFVAYATAGGKTEQLCRDLIAGGKAVLTFDSPANAKLIGMGAIPMKPGELVQRWNQSGRRVSLNSVPSSCVQ